MVRHVLMLAASVTLLLVATDAQASDTTAENTTVHTTPNGILVGGETHSQENPTPTPTTQQPVSSTAEGASPGQWVQASDPCQTVGASGCVEAYTCPDGSAPTVWLLITPSGPTASYSQCPEDPPPTEDTTPTATVNIPAEVSRAFKEVALPDSTINVQPPGGETLVNLPTILSTTAERHQIPVRLGRVNLDILLEVWPSRFVWHHGDGTSQETTTPGEAWTEGADLADLITHTYSKTSKGLELSVDTTWSAQFRVVGQGGWRPVDGTVTIAGAPVAVAVLEAKPQLVR